MAYDPNMFSQFGGYPAAGTGGWYGDPNSPQYLPGPESQQGAGNPYAALFGGQQGGGQGMYGGQGGQYGNPYAGFGQQAGQPPQQSPQTQGVYGTPSFTGYNQAPSSPPGLTYGNGSQQGAAQQTARFAGAPNASTGSIPQANATVGQQRQDRNAVVGAGGKPAMATLLQEQGVNPYFSGNPYAQDVMNNSDNLTLQAKIDTLMNPGETMEAAMAKMSGNVMGNKGVYFDPQTAKGVYESVAPLAQSYANHQNISGPAQMAAELFFGSDSAPNVAQLLYGTQTGALGQALQSSVLQQAARGQFMYQHPDQFGINPENSGLGWLNTYLNATQRGQY